MIPHTKNPNISNEPQKCYIYFLECFPRSLSTKKKFFFYRYIYFFVLPKTEGSAETGSLTFSGAIIDVKSINIITDIYRIMFISNSIPVVAVWKIEMKTRSDMCLWSFSLNQFYENFRVTDFTENFVTICISAW